MVNLEVYENVWNHIFRGKVKYISHGSSIALVNEYGVVPPLYVRDDDGTKVYIEREELVSVLKIE